MELTPADAAVRQLVRRLCRNVAAQQVIDARVDPHMADGLQPQLEDIAHTILLGLHPTASPAYVPPDARPAPLAAAVAAAAKGLHQDGYPGLALQLQAAADGFERFNSCHLLGTLAEAECGAAAVMPLTEHAAVLFFLLGLAGSQPSVRCRRLTFQADGEAAAAPSSKQEHTTLLPDDPTDGDADWPYPPLSTLVFAEPPDPFALTNSNGGVAVLLPSELGLPSEAFAGYDDIQDLGAGLSKRPVWCPTAAPAVPPPASSAWLPMPPSLLLVQQRSRQQQGPRPLGLALSMLSMDQEPGSSTMFSAGPGTDEVGSWDVASDGGDAASADSIQPQACLLSDGREAQVEHAAPQQLLWTLGEADLARAALLALQGLAAPLLRLQAMLGTPRALPRDSVAGLLAPIVTAAELRQRLQLFVAAYSSQGTDKPGAGVGGFQSGAGHLSKADTASPCASGQDLVQQAFAAAISRILLQQSAALQALERREVHEWVEEAPAGGALCRRLHGRGPTLLQVALHTRGLQLQLQTLADLCWCWPVASDPVDLGAVDHGGPATPRLGPAADGRRHDAQRLGEQQQQRSPSPRWRWQERFPSGTALLDYLYSRASEADDVDAPLLRFLWEQAMQPHVRHMQEWAFTAHAINREFGTAGDKELIALAFLPPEQRSGILVPADPPACLRPLHAALLRAGCQLRLLASLEQHGARLVRQLGDVANDEAQQRASSCGRGGEVGPKLGPTGRHAALGEQQAGAAAPHSGRIPHAPSAELAAASAWLDLAADEPWVSLASGATELSAHKYSVLQLSHGSLEQAVQISHERDAARTAVVDAWLQQLALQRRLDERAEVLKHVQRHVAARERAAASSAARAEALSRQLSAKSSLLREQRAAAAESRSRRALERAQQESLDREQQVQSAVREHAAAVAELAEALGAAALQPHPTQPARAAAAAREAMEAAPGVPVLAGMEGHPVRAGQNGAGEDAPPLAPQLSLPLLPGLPPLKLANQHPQDEQQQQRQQLHEDAVPCGLPSARLPWAPQLPAQPAHAAPVLPSAALQHQLTLAEAEPEGGPAPPPLSVVLETGVAYGVLSQYRAVSRACVRLFLDELRILEHLEALRRFFFQGAGDWAEALVAALGAHADSLQPLSGSRAEQLLADAARGTSGENDPFVSHLRIRMLRGGSSAIQAQDAALQSATPSRRARTGWTAHHSTMLAPTQLDCMDCVSLDYQVGWPLSAVITEDTLQGYAAVFSLMVRLRRTAQLLRQVAAPLAAQPRSTSDVLLSEEDADRCHRRIQALRAFRFGAAQFVGACQTFLHSRTTGDAWAHLLAKLMVSSEEVAAAVVTRQPSAPLAGLLSRMNSLGPAGQAAHALAQRMNRALGLQASQPGTPSGAGGSSSQLALFNSLLSAAPSAANSAAPSPRAGGGPADPAVAATTQLPITRQLSRFAGQLSLSRLASLPPAEGEPLNSAGEDSLAAGTRLPAVAAATVADSGGGGGAGEQLPLSAPDTAKWSAAATVGGQGGLPVSARPSMTSAMLAQAADEAAAAVAAAPTDVEGGAGLDVGQWAQQVQHLQQGIADLQELLDLHRRYVRQASEECLTFGGSPAVRQAVEGCLQSLLDFAFRLRAAVRGGAGQRPHGTWAQALRQDSTWLPLAALMRDFERRAGLLQQLLDAAGGRGALAELRCFDLSWCLRRGRGRQRQA